MALSGLTGAVTFNGASTSCDKWEADLAQVSVDRSSFQTEGEPKTAPGQRTGKLSCEGPYEQVLGIDRGNLVNFVFVTTTALNVTVTGRVTKVKFSNDKDTGPRFAIEAEQDGAATINM